MQVVRLGFWGIQNCNYNQDPPVKLALVIMKAVVKVSGLGGLPNILASSRAHGKYPSGQRRPRKVCAKLAAAGPGTRAAGSCAGDHRSLPESAWKKIHQQFQQTALSFTSPSSQTQRGEAMGGRADCSGSHRSLPASAWERIHQKFQQTAPSSTSPSSEVQRDEAIADHQKFQQTACSPTACRANWTGDHRSLPESAWKTIHETFDSPRRPEPAATSGWWMAFCQQATRDLCCSR